MHYIPLIDPGISGSEKPGTYPPYDEGLQMDIFIKNATGLPFVGKVSVLLRMLTASVV
jgi:lysosomal alpha-glucosidase